VPSKLLNFLNCRVFPPLSSRWACPELRSQESAMRESYGIRELRSFWIYLVSETIYVNIQMILRHLQPP
jgi:hypothetical protein